MTEEGLPRKIRVSSGSARVLGLTEGILDAKPTTIYLLTFRSSKCYANCAFCPQARESKGRADALSRVTWPPFPTELVLSGIEQAFGSDATERVCLQALNYSTVFEDILNVATEIISRVNVPVSVSCQPISREEMRRLSGAGVQRISIPLDAATKRLFDRVKGQLAGGPYIWEKQLKALRDAVDVFGRNLVTTHLIVGLGEKEQEIVRRVQWCVDHGIYPSLFSFTPILGTVLEDHLPPSISHYRRIQIAHHLITNGQTRYEDMVFKKNGALKNFGVSKQQLWHVIRTGKPFRTSGCPGCNRPYYNERPSGPIYNYPRELYPEEISEIEKQIRI